MALDIRLENSTKVYHEGDTIKGVVLVESKSPLTHQGMMVTLDGVAALTVNSKNVGRIEAIYSNVKPIVIAAHGQEIAKAGRLAEGISEMPFQFVLSALPSTKYLYETYHGVNITIQYMLKCVMKRPRLTKDLTKECEIMVEYKKGEQAVVKTRAFNITPASIQNLTAGANVPRFSIKGELDSTICCLTQPLTGELTIENCDLAVRSIELQLLRVETVGSQDNFAKESSEIQNIEIGSGDVCHGLGIPIHMIFPRLFCCPSLDSAVNFKINFQLNVVVLFVNDLVISESFPLKLTRF